MWGSWQSNIWNTTLPLIWEGTAQEEVPLTTTSSSWNLVTLKLHRRNMRGPERTWMLALFDWPKNKARSLTNHKGIGTGKDITYRYLLPGKSFQPTFSLFYLDVWFWMKAQQQHAAQEVPIENWLVWFVLTLALLTSYWRVFLCERPNLSKQCWFNSPLISYTFMGGSSGYWQACGRQILGGFSYISY